MASTGDKGERDQENIGSETGSSWKGQDQNTTSSPGSNTGSSSNYSGTSYSGQGTSPSTFGAAGSSAQGSVGGGRQSTTYTGSERGYGSNPGTSESWQRTASNVVGRAQNVADELSHRAQDVANQARDYARDTASRVQDFAGQYSDDLSMTVRRHPVESLLIGFGIGCLIGFLLPRR